MRFRQPIHSFLFALALLVLAGGLSSCQKEAGVSRTDEGQLVLGEAEQTAVLQRAVAVGSRTLVLDGFAGNVTLTSDPGAEVASLTFTKRARGRTDEDAREAMERVTLEESGTETSYQFTMRSRDPNMTSVDIEGTVPPDTRVRVDVGGGSVALSDVRGPIQVAMEGGPVRIAGATENVDVQTTNGTIEVGMARVPENGTVRLRSSNGDLALTLPGTAQAQVEAQTSAGTINTNGLDFSDQRLNREGAGARFRGRLGRDGGSVELRTENGSITLNGGRMLRLETPRSTTPPVQSSADSTEASSPDSVVRPDGILQPDTTTVPPDTTALPQAPRRDTSRQDV